MKHVALILAAGLVSGCMAGEPAEPSAAAQAELAAELADRSAGEPTPCVSLRELRGNRSIGSGLILFDGTGDTVWVNRPPDGCPVLNQNRSLVTRTFSTRLCRGDVARVVDSNSGIEYGSCSLGDFTPYRRTS